MLYRVTHLNLPFHRLCLTQPIRLHALCNCTSSLQHIWIVQITGVFLYICIKVANELKCKVIAIFNGQDQSDP